jgi:hypothetical protein
MTSQGDDNSDTREQSMTTKQQPSRPSRTAARYTLIAAAVSVTLRAGFAPSAGRTRSEASHVVVTPAQAKAAATAWNQLDDTVSSTFDLNMLDQVEAPPLLAIDTPVLQDAKARGAPPPAVIRIANLTVSVPKQTSYPAQFSARIDGSNGATTFYVFVMASKHAPWKAVYQATLLANAPPPDLALDRRGYANTIPEQRAKKQLKLDPAILGRTYSDFLNANAPGGAPASSTTFSPDVAQPLLSALTSSQIPGAERVVNYAPVDYPVYSYRTRDGGTFSLFAVSIDMQTTASGGGAITYSQPLFALAPGQRY